MIHCEALRGNSETNRLARLRSNFIAVYMLTPQNQSVVQRLFGLMKLDAGNIGSTGALRQSDGSECLSDLAVNRTFCLFFVIQRGSLEVVYTFENAIPDGRYMYPAFVFQNDE